MFWLFDPTYILLLPAIILTLWAQAKVTSAYRRWSTVRSRSGLTGAEVARAILDSYGLYDIPVQETSGHLTDNYNPIKKTLNLSESVYGSDSIAAIGVAAHEAGHAIQHSHNYFPLKLRNGIFPVANFGSWLAFPLFFMGLIFGSRTLIDIGIWLFTGFVAFTIITLPVEFNASKRAIAILENSGYLTSYEIKGAKEVLNAAALTYVAAAATAVMNLLRLLLLRNMTEE